MDIADSLVAGKGDGRISAEDAEALFAKLENDHKYTELEKDTIAYIRSTYKFTDAGDKALRRLIRSWAAHRGHGSQND